MSGGIADRDGILKIMAMFLKVLLFKTLIEYHGTLKIELFSSTILENIMLD